MAFIHPCTTEDELRRLLAESQAQPVVLFKHSTRCPISAAGRRQFLAFAEAHPEVPCWEVLVVEQRPLSQQIATETGVAHQSPQAMVLKAGKPVWHASHYNITQSALEQALEQ